MDAFGKLSAIFTFTCAGAATKLSADLTEYQDADSKMEDTGLMDAAGGADAQTLGDIQTYLASFNKEIGDGPSIPSLTGDQNLLQVPVKF